MSVQAIRHVAGAIQRVLLLEALPNPEVNFLQLGGDSLSARQVVHSLVSPDLAGEAIGLLRASLLSGLLEGVPLGELERFIEPSPIAVENETTAASSEAANAGIAPGQYRMWLLWDRDPADISHNIVNVWRLTGELDVAALAAAIHRAGSVLDSFKANIGGLGDPLTVTYDRPRSTSFRFWDLRSLPRQQQEEVSNTLLWNYSRTAYSARRGVLLRGLAMQLAQNTWRFAVLTHHIAADGYSMALLYRKLNSWYAEAAAGHELPARDSEASFACWQALEARRVEAMRNAADDEFWLGYLQDVDWSRPLRGSVPGSSPNQAFGRERRGALPLPREQSFGEYQQKFGATAFELVLAAFWAVVRRHGGPRDLVVGVVVANRDTPDDKAVIGPITNTIVVRLNGTSCHTFLDAVEMAKAALRAALTHAHRPLEEVLALVRPRTPPGQNPLSAVFVYQNIPPTELRLQEVQTEKETFDPGVAKFDLMFEMGPPAAGRMELRLEYAPALYNEGMVNRFLARFSLLWLAALEQPQTELERLPFFTSDDLGILASFDRISEAPPFAGILPPFDQQVRTRPNAPAIREGGFALTYGDLDRRSRSIASLLASAPSLGRGRVVAIYLPPGADFVACVLAVLRRGLAYVAFDPTAEDVQLTRKLELAEPVAMLTKREWHGTLPEVPFTLLFLPANDGAEAEDEVETVPPEPEWPCHVIFTSGSTGGLKAVPGPYQGLGNRLAWQEYEHPVAPAERIAVRVPLSFVDHVVEMLAPLRAGAELIYVSPIARASVSALIALLQCEKINRLTITPQLLEQLIRVLKDDCLSLPHLAHIAVSGDELRPAILQNARRLLPGCRIVNIYGSTEVAADAAAEDVTHSPPATPVPLGRPLPGFSVMIVDEELALLPPESVGEICVAGVGVTPGYLHEASGSSAFPDVRRGDGSTIRAFRTGDFGCLTATGALLFRGRRREHVLLGGIRVDLAEAARRIEQRPEVSACVMVPCGEETAPVLVAFVTLAPEVVAESNALRKQFVPWLAGMAVPAIVEILDELPRDRHGKVDYRALRAYVPARLEDERSSFNDIEQLVSRTWSAVLELPVIARAQDFFAAGGDSARAMEIVYRLNRELAIELKFADLRDFPTLGGFSARLLHLLRTRYGQQTAPPSFPPSPVLAHG